MTASSDRSRRMRERRRQGLLLVPIEVAARHRRALEAMGLIEEGEDRNPEAIAWAVQRFLDLAPIVQAMGEAIYPGAGAEHDTASPEPAVY